MQHAHKTTRGIPIAEAGISRHVSVSNGKLKAKPFSSAEYTLIDLLQLEITQSIYAGPIVYDNVVIQALYVSTVFGTAIYYKIDQYMNTSSANLTAMLGYAVAGVNNFYYNDPAGDYSLWYDLEELDKVSTNNTKPEQMLEWLANLPKSTVASEHHVHYDAIQTLSVVKEIRGIDMYKQILAYVYNNAKLYLTTTFAAGVILWLASIPEWIYVKMIQHQLPDAIDNFNTFCKNLSIKAKLLQNLHINDLRPIFEINVLVNRITDSVDWETEKINRTKPTLADFTDQVIYDTVRQILSGKSKFASKPKIWEWETFWKNRWQWSTTGSYHSQYDADTYMIAPSQEFKNKFFTMNMLPSNLPFDEFIQRKPEIRAWPSTKYEWGKQRAIYGCDLTSYIISTFAFPNVEDTLPDIFPVGRNSNENYVHSKLSSILQRRVPFCLDFEDFNSQHSYGAMQAALRAWFDVHKTSLSEDQRKAALWTIESIPNTYVEPNTMYGTPSYKCNGTLMSGWRLTSMVNSLLNAAYTKLMAKGLDETLLSVHNGDDVLIATTNLATVQRIYNNAHKHNIRISKNKTTLGGIAEFLRVDHWAGGTGGQYLTRNIATLLHGRIESKRAVSTVDLLEAMELRLLEYEERGGTRVMANALRDAYYNKIASDGYLNFAQLEKIRTSHRVVGGLNPKPDADIDTCISVGRSRRARTPRTTLKKYQEDVRTYNYTNIPKDIRVEAICSYVKLPGVVDYGEDLANLFGITDELRKKEMIRKVRTLTLDALRLEHKHVSLSENSRMGQSRVERSIYKAFKGVVLDAKFGKAKMVGIPIGDITDLQIPIALQMRLSDAKDVSHAMRVLL